MIGQPGRAACTKVHIPLNSLMKPVMLIRRRKKHRGRRAVRNGQANTHRMPSNRKAPLSVSQLLRQAERRGSPMVLCGSVGQGYKFFSKSLLWNFLSFYDFGWSSLIWISHYLVCLSRVDGAVLTSRWAREQFSTCGS